MPLSKTKTPAPASASTNTYHLTPHLFRLLSPFSFLLYSHSMPWPDAAYPKTVARRGAARGHLADLRVVVHQDYRHRGLGTALLSELLDVARDSGLSGVLFEAVADAQAQALAAAESLGFIRLGLVHGGAIDPDGRLHDVVLLVMPLRRRRSSADF